MKSFLIAALLMLSFLCNAQVYKFMYSTGTYTEITGGTAILQSTGAYNDSITLPYNFTLAGVTSKKIQVMANGRITAGPYSITSPWFWAFEGGEVSHGVYSDLTTGTTGDRITKIQFKNNWFDHEWANGNQSRCNFQIWLYEKDSTVEVHYGPSNIVDVAGCYQGASGPAVGLPGLFAKGNASSPSSTASASYLAGTPPNGVIYRFGPSISSSGVNTINTTKNGIYIYPLPAHDKLYIKSENADQFGLEIFDITGRSIASYARQRIDEQIDISELQKGTYILKTSESIVIPFVKD